MKRIERRTAQFASVICQLVPSLCSVANLPAVAARMAVPAAPPAAEQIHTSGTRENGLFSLPFFLG